MLYPSTLQPGKMALQKVYLHSDEIAYKEPSYLDIHCCFWGFEVCHGTICHSVLDFCLTPLF